MTPSFRTVFTSLRKLLELVKSATETRPRGEIDPSRTVTGEGLSPGASTLDDRHNAGPKVSGSSDPPGDTPADAPGKVTRGTSIQHKLDRIRLPSRRMTYDVEIPGGLVKRELPFVIGVLADLSGDDDPPGPLCERRFQRLDRDNLESYLRSVGPTLRLSVLNRLQAGGPPLVVGLKFQAIEDFRPAGVALQIEPLRALLGTRESLRRLRSMMDRSEALEGALRRTLDDPGAVAALVAESRCPRE